MELVQERSVDTSRVSSPLHWHFRTLPIDVQRGAIRRLALSGVSEQEIAARTGWSVAAVRRAVREDECIARLVAPQTPMPLHGNLI
jgi:hypothetical protein